MFHIELSEGLETVSRYNLTQEQLYATVLSPWKRGEPVQLGERTWRPRHTRIVVLDGPWLPPGLLTMGRGWTNAIRQGRDVTSDVLATFEQRYTAAHTHHAPAVSSPTGAPIVANGSHAPAPLAHAPAPVGADAAVATGTPPSAAGGQQLLADAFALELLERLADAPLSLNAVWRLAGERHPQLEAARSLQLAADAVASLLSAKLVVIGSTTESGEPQPIDAPVQRLVERVREMEGWLVHSGAGSLRIARA
ncbi:MAG: hypothetical protein ACYCUM_10980 [Solirubrobacteraceae bacterium]